MTFFPALLISALLSLSVLAGDFTPVLEGHEAISLDPGSPEGIEALIVLISEKLRGRPYVGGNLGEGSAGIYDQDPLYRLDAFDCTTFIETVVTNVYCNGERSSAASVESCLKGTMQKIRYFDDSTTFESRNHIAETDWIASSVRRGFMRDVTQNFGGSKTKYSRVVTDKKSWFESRSLLDIQTKDDLATKKKKLSELQSTGGHLSPEAVSVPYLGFDSLFLPGPGHEPNTDLLKRLPNGAIFNVVRENWDPPGSGTPLAISHQGFIVQKSDGTYLRHASTSKTVRDVKLAEYMLQYINSPTIRGLNILQVQPKP